MYFTIVKHILGGKASYEFRVEVSQVGKRLY
jgi:hypothetical protein